MGRVADKHFCPLGCHQLAGEEGECCPNAEKVLKSQGLVEFGGTMGWALVDPQDVGSNASGSSDPQSFNTCDVYLV